MGRESRKLGLVSVFTLAVCVIVFPTLAGAVSTTVTVECSNSKAKIRTIMDGLAQLPTTGESTLLVSGTCHEDVTILNFTRLTIQGNPTATIDFGTNPDFGLGMGNSFVTMRNLTVTGGLGVLCATASTCRLFDVVIQDSLDAGVYFFPGTTGSLVRCTIQNNPNSDGLIVDRNATVSVAGTTIQGNGTSPDCGTDCGGAFLHQGSNLVVAHDGSTGTVIRSYIQNNDAYGIRVRKNSTLGLRFTTISGNGTDGIQLKEGSVASFGNSNTIITNGGHGLRIGDLSMAEFEGSNNDLTGNTTQDDIICDPSYSVMRVRDGFPAPLGNNGCPDPGAPNP